MNEFNAGDGEIIIITPRNRMKFVMMNRETFKSRKCKQKKIDSRSTFCVVVDKRLTSYWTEKRHPLLLQGRDIDFL